MRYSTGVGYEIGHTQQVVGYEVNILNALWGYQIRDTQQVV
jgi:hypothetical protein